MIINREDMEVRTVGNGTRKYGHYYGTIPATTIEAYARQSIQLAKVAAEMGADEYDSIIGCDEEEAKKMAIIFVTEWSPSKMEISKIGEEMYEISLMSKDEGIRRRV